MSIPPPTPTPCFALKGFFCSDIRLSEQCPESYYCRGGLLPPARCPDGKWAPAGSMYLADCGNRFETEFAVIVSLIIVFAGLSLCLWAYLDWSHVFGTSYPVKKVCVYKEDAIPTAQIVYDPTLGSCSRMVTAYPNGRHPIRYILIPGTIPPV